ncbi:MAG: LarC family nickel insertion protein, partial [Lachnospiraceae bacterium]|nr:LarC family nickel insertion protein [Lachnospiraceae bacterium]
MKTLYLDCGMGAAGDMLTAALLELIPDRDGFVSRLNGLGIPKVFFSAEKASKCGITGTHITVRVDGEEETEDMHSSHHHEHDHEHVHDHDHDHDHHFDHDHEHDHGHEHGHEHEHSHDHDQHHEHGHHHHSGMHDIEHIVGDLPVSDKVKADVLAVYSLIAEAESHVHGVSVEEIHFHEVGTMDAIADVTAVCMLMEEISPDKVVASDVHVGSGQVRCAHGILPVPAPATAYILRDVPIYGGSIKG